MRAVLLALVFVCAVAAQSLPAQAVITQQIDKISKVALATETQCSSDGDVIQRELATRRLKVARFEQQIKTVRQRFEISRASLQRELESVVTVETLVRSLSSGSTVSNRTISSANASISELQQSPSSARMAGVLRNIVVSISTSSAPSIELDLAEVLKLLGDLRANIETTLKVDSVSQEEKTISEQMTVENASIQDLSDKLAKVRGDCDRRKSEYTEILSVLKLVEQQYQNVTIPNCQPALDEKDKVLNQCLSDKETLVKTVQESDGKIAQCESIRKEFSECRTFLSECQSDTSKTPSKALDQCQAENKEVRTQIETIQKQYTTLVSTNTATEAKLIETRQALDKATEAAKCNDQKSQITQLESRLQELSVKVELGEKCAANYKAQQIEKTEMLKQLEKMTVLNKQLDTCNFEAAKAAKECSDKAAEQIATTNKVIEKYTEESKKQSEEIARLTEASKCTNEKSVIEKYEKEVVTIKTETRTVVTQIESDVKGCKAELETLKTLRSKDESSLNECTTKVSSLETQVKILQSDKSSCVNSQTDTQTTCKAVATELAQCQTDLKVQTENITNSVNILRKVQEEKELLAAEVHKLEIEEQGLKKEVTTLTTKITESESTIVTLKNQLAEKEASEKKLLEQKSTFEQTLSKKVETLTTIEKKIETVEITLKSEQAGNDKLIEELQKLHGEREALLKGKVEAEAQLEKIKIEIGNLQDFKAGAIKHLEDARDVIVASDKKIEELSSRLSSAASRRATLTHRLGTCDAQLEAVDKTVKVIRKDLTTCQNKVADQAIALQKAEEAAKCLAHQATIAELKKSGFALRVDLRAATSLKEQVLRKASALEAKVQAYSDLNNKLQEEVRDLADGHAGCRSSVRSLKNQMLSNLRRIKEQVSSVSSLEVRLAAAQVELGHTRKQWQSDRTAYKTFKDNLLNQMAKLISLAKDSKHKFDVARAAAKNELKVQDAQWGVCRKEVLNYERILGSGVVKAEKEKMKAFLASRRYVAVKSGAEAALRKAQKRTGATPESREQQRAQRKVNEQLTKLEKKKPVTSAKAVRPTPRPVIPTATGAPVAKAVKPTPKPVIPTATGAPVASNKGNSTSDGKKKVSSAAASLAAKAEAALRLAKKQKTLE